MRRGVLVLAMLAAFNVQSAGLPELGDSARNSLSTVTESKIGRDIMARIRSGHGYNADAVTVDYLTSLGEQLAAASADPARSFEFFLVHDKSVNAFALPGGYIGVHSGLIATTENESELASVLAHEIAHITQHHLARVLDAGRVSSMTSAASVVIALLAARTDPTLAQAAIVGAQATAAQAQLNFTREHEREADRAGLQTLSDAGFTTQAMGTFFKRLQAKNRVYESDAPAYLRTHPLTVERLADIQNRLAALPYRQAVDSPEYALVKARVMAAAGEAHNALVLFKDKTSSDAKNPANWYGLSQAYIRTGNPAQAELALHTARGLSDDSPILALAGVELALATKQSQKALDLSKVAQYIHPGYRPLAYAHARALLSTGSAKEALVFLAEKRRNWGTDSEFPTMHAEAFQQLGQPVESALALADSYELRGQTGEARTQLEMAQRLAGKDYRANSQIDARLKRLRDKGG